MGLLWLAGASFYFYEPLAGMTNPPMEWGYPRTVAGFFEALSRGQYNKVVPTDIFHDFHHFVIELGMLVEGVADAFSWVYMFFAFLPLLFFFKMQKRERAWIVLVAGLYPFLGVLLTITLNPTPDRQIRRFGEDFLPPFTYAGGHYDRLWAGLDRGVYGHALPEVSALGTHGRCRGGAAAGVVQPQGCHRKNISWAWTATLAGAICRTGSARLLSKINTACPSLPI